MKESLELLKLLLEALLFCLYVPFVAVAVCIGMLTLGFRILCANLIHRIYNEPSEEESYNDKITDLIRLFI